jgi:hypothetical protein
LHGRYRCRATQILETGEKMPMRIARFLCWMALLASVLVYRIDGAAAQGSDAGRQACTPDAMRLCADVIPDVAKVTACMKAKRAQLSEPCRLVMVGGGDEHRHHHRARHCGRHSRHCG